MNRALPLFERVAASIAALYCCAGIALGAYAAHATVAGGPDRLERASLYLLLHGIAVAALAISRPSSRLDRTVLVCLLLGSAMFSGSLSVLSLMGLPATLAPYGGVMMMSGWLLAAFALLRRSMQHTDC